jgi:hypothetical protein
MLLSLHKDTYIMTKKSIFNFFSSIRNWFIGLFKRKEKKPVEVKEVIPPPNLPPTVEPTKETEKQQPKDETVKPAKTEKEIKEPFAAFVILPFLATEKSTLSKLFYRGSFVCYILEDGHNQIKIAGETRIAAGVWKCKKRRNGKFYKDYSKRFKHGFVISILCDGFTNVLFHAGNTVFDTKGCPLTGLAYHMKKGNFEISPGTSIPAYEKLYLLFEKEFAVHGDVWLKVVR